MKWIGTLTQDLLIGQSVSGEALLRVVFKENSTHYHRSLASRKLLVEEIMGRGALKADLHMEKSS